nr:FecR domain-containing protein [Aeoliella straminimaris]
MLCIEIDIRQVIRVEQAQYAMGLTDGREISSPQTPARTAWYRRGLAVAIACSLLLAVAYRWNEPVEPQGTGVTNRDVDAGKGEGKPVFAATLSETRDCVWDTTTASYASGHLFVVGQELNLVSGAVQLCFETGVLSIVEGPAQFTLRENAMDLSLGRVSAVVPKSATGFAVVTPTSEVIDLGTEFGVSVEKSGASQVHVFSGEVVARSRNIAGEIVGESLFVTTNNAISFGPDSEQYHRLVSDEAAFAKMLNVEDDTYSDIQPPVNRPLLLWLTCGHWVIDDQQCVSVWRDAVCEENTIPDNALQASPEARPRVVGDGFNGHAVLHFDGQDDFLVTTPFHSGNSQTVAFVASVGCVSPVKPDDPRYAPQIISYNGPPQINAAWFSAPNMLEINATARSADRIAVNAYAYVGHRGGGRPPGTPIFVGEVDTGFVGAAGSKHLYAGRVETDLRASRAEITELPSVGEPFVAVYVYDYDTHHAELWINNQTVGFTSAPAPIELTSRKVIGRHGITSRQFCGDIAEVMIYDAALDNSEVATLSESLAEKYGIALPFEAEAEANPGDL